MYQTKCNLNYKKRANIYSNSSGTNTFDPETCRAYSYSWWCYVKRIKGKLVFNEYTYSPTTSGHQSAMRWLLNELGLKIDVFVSVESGLCGFEYQALKPLYRELFELEVYNGRKGVRQKTKDRNIKRMAGIRDDIKVYRSLGAKFSRKQQSELKKWALANETRRIERLAAERKTRPPTRSTNRMLKEVHSFAIVS